MGLHKVTPVGNPGDVYWFYGGSGSGKTNIAIRFDIPNKIVLDSDALREVWQNEDFSDDGRMKQNLWLARLAGIITAQGFNVVIASVCPFEDKSPFEEIIPWVTWIEVRGPHTKPTDWK